MLEKLQVKLNENSEKIIHSLVILNLAFALKFAIMGVGVNLLLVTISTALILFNYKKLLYPLKSRIFLYFLPLALAFPLITSPYSFRIQSYAYALMFLAVYQVYVSELSNRKIEPGYYVKILKFIISAYFLVALIQSISFPFGIFFNQIWTSDEVTRINSLATEPSYAGIIIVITFYSYLVFQKRENGKYLLFDFKNDLKYWFYFLFTIIVTQSGFAFVFFILLLLTLIPSKHIIRYGIAIAACIAVVFFIGSHLNLEPVIRVKRLFYSVLTLDINLMVQADHSGSIRIAPVVIFLTSFDFLDINSWLGHGIGFNNQLMASIIPGINIDEWKGGGFFPTFVYDYGLIATIIFLAFLIQNAIPRVLSIEIVFLLLIFLNTSFNTQVFWFSIILFTTNKYLKNRLRIKTQKSTDPGSSAKHQLL